MQIVTASFVSEGRRVIVLFHTLIAIQNGFVDRNQSKYRFVIYFLLKYTNKYTLKV